MVFSGMLICVDGDVFFMVGLVWVLIGCWVICWGFKWCEILFYFYVGMGDVIVKSMVLRDWDVFYLYFWCCLLCFLCYLFGCYGLFVCILWYYIIVIFFGGLSFWLEMCDFGFFVNIDEIYLKVYIMWGILVFMLDLIWLFNNGIYLCVMLLFLWF